VKSSPLATEISFCKKTQSPRGGRHCGDLIYSRPAFVFDEVDKLFLNGVNIKKANTVGPVFIFWKLKRKRIKNY
jgi:hypothetical protein